jgi:hypothetical protein
MVVGVAAVLVRVPEGFVPRPPRKYQPAAPTTRRSTNAPAAIPTRRPVFEPLDAGAAWARAAAIGGGGGGERRGGAGAAAGDTTVAGAALLAVSMAACRVGVAFMVGGAAGTLIPGAVATSACRSVGVEPGRVRARRSSVRSRPVW